MGRNAGIALVALLWLGVSLTCAHAGPKITFPPSTPGPISERLEVQTLTASDAITISPTLALRQTVPVQGADGAVTLTSDPQITAGLDGQVILIFGTNETDRVTLINGAGVALCGTNVAEYAISASQSAELQYDESRGLWQQLNCQATIDGVIPEPTPIEQAFTQSETGRITGATPAKSLLLENPLNSDEVFGWRWDPSHGLVQVRPVGPQRSILDPNSPLEVYDATGTLLSSLDSTGKVLGTAHPVFACKDFFDVSASDDNLLFIRWDLWAITITGISVVYDGSAPSTPAAFVLADGDDNALSYAVSGPTPEARTGIPTIAAVTEDAAARLSVGETLLISVGNTPDPTTTTYQVCVFGKRR